MRNLFRALHDAGVLSINRRNAKYTLLWNPRRFYPRVDDKLLSKQLCIEAGIPVPARLAAADHHFELDALMRRLAELPSFALKPARGAMGNGIIVISGRDGERFVRPSGRRMDAAALRYHAAGIISGLYALGGHSDAVLVEERLEVHPTLADVVAEGVPDIRVIVFRGIPVMCMTRLPTHRSGGRANLHQGAIGAGIDLVTGRTMHAVLENRPIARHPDTDRRVIDVAIPDFDTVLDIATRAADTTGLGYVGADVVVDAQRGPVILELNARPGLAIQIANHAGLRPRLDAIDAAWQPDLPVARRIEIGRAIARAREAA